MLRSLLMNNIPKHSNKQVALVLKAIQEAVLQPNKVVVIVGVDHVDMIRLNKLYVYLTSSTFRSECSIIFRTTAHRLTATIYTFVGYNDV